MRALAMSDNQLDKLKLTAATLPPELRGDLLKLTGGLPVATLTSGASALLGYAG